jgi:gliding motility-associated-like protein
VTDPSYDITLKDGLTTVTELTRVATITNDDQAIISIADVTVREADKQAVITITMDNPVDKAVTITGNTRQTGSAAKGSDYLYTEGSSYTFDKGDTFTNSAVTITIVDDNLVEATESFLLELSDIIATDRNVVFNGGGSTVSGEITVTDADAATISITNETVSEDGANMLFTVSLSAPVDKSVTISANTINKTATGGGADFTSVVNAPITFSATDNDDQTLIVQIANDDVVEGIETFDLVLSNITVEAGRDVTFVGGGSTTVGIGTITDEDAASISITSVSKPEGNTGSQSYDFEVMLTGDVDQSVTVDYMTQDGTATVANDDYTAASGTLTFSGTSGEKLIVSIDVIGDLVVEDSETFSVLLSNLDASGKNVTFTNDTGVGTLTNDDVKPEVTTELSFSVSEGAANAENVGTVTASKLNGTASWTITAGNDDGAFAINASTGQITVADQTKLDRETTAAYTLTVIVSDGFNESDPETVAITVTDVNDNAPVVTAATFSLSDDASIGHQIGFIAATDADENPSFTNWLITGGNDDEVFALNSLTGELTVADNSNLDFDQTPSYSLMITVSDGTFISAAQTISITIIDTNDAPTDITLTDSENEDGDGANVDILESVNTGTEVGVFASVDVDNNDEHTYELVSGVGSEQNELFTINGSRLIVDQPLDFEDTPVASIRVRSTDKSGESFEKVFTIVLIADIRLQLDIPTAITPNNDGLNDTWIIDNITTKSGVKVTITDTQKNIIFSSLGYDRPFDGTYNGQPLPYGAYPYFIQTADGVTKGILHILRIDE